MLFTPLLAVVLPPVQVVGWLTPNQVLTDCLTLSAHWRRWDGYMVRLILPAALAGTACGAAFLAWAPAIWVQRAIGLVAMAFVLQQYLARCQAAPQPGTRAGHQPVLAVAVGLVGRITSALAHAGGIVLTIYMLPRLDKTVFVSTLTALLLVLNGVKLVLYWQLGVVATADLGRSLLVVPLLVLGSWAGARIHHRLSQRRFLDLASGMVAVAGVALIAGWYGGCGVAGTP